MFISRVIILNEKPLFVWIDVVFIFSGVWEDLDAKFLQKKNSEAIYVHGIDAYTNDIHTETIQRVCMFRYRLHIYRNIILGLHIYRNIILRSHTYRNIIVCICTKTTRKKGFRKCYFIGDHKDSSVIVDVRQVLSSNLR